MLLLISKDRDSELLSILLMPSGYSNDCVGQGSPSRNRHSDTLLHVPTHQADSIEEFLLVWSVGMGLVLSFFHVPYNEL